MRCNDVDNLLNEYVDGELAPALAREVESHLDSCPACRREEEAVRSLVRGAAALPRSIEPDRDLWGEIDGRLGPRKNLAAHVRRGACISAVRSPRAFAIARTILGAAAVIAVAVGIFLITGEPSVSSWQVARVEGTPRVGSGSLADSRQFRVGEWLETDASSRARIEVGAIGSVEVEPNSRVQLLRALVTDHRLALDRGTIQARIWAPPRLFFVETPSATVIDLGCVYTLAVDERGAGVLRVTQGWVALQFGGRESVVPAGAMCVTRPGLGPGTPFLEDAGERFRAALLEYDFEGGGPESLAEILREARNMDSITLWHLLLRTSGSDREVVYDRLAELVPAPEQVTREGVLSGDPDMLERWQRHLNLGVRQWWEFWR